MRETDTFLMPAYYPQFACKMGDCRSACCTGWPITVSMENYFRLLGLDCPKHIRQRLDVGLRVMDHPTADCYAQFNPRYDGNCPLRAEDGRCCIQGELGEETLPDICRLYPRGIRTWGEKECSCANSCEAVIELLGKEKEPMAFVQRTMTVNLPKLEAPASRFDTLGRGQALRMLYIRLLQDRTRTLPERLAALYGVVAKTEELLQRRDEEGLERLLSSAEQMYCEETPWGEELTQAPVEALSIVEQMLSVLCPRHESIRDYGERALAVLGGVNLTVCKQAKEHFEKVIPGWENWFEQLLVNHMFFSRFPFQERPVSLTEECGALYAVYALLRYLGIGCMADREDETYFVDLAAAAFRMIDHTEFEPYAAVLLKNLGYDTHEKSIRLLLI